MKARDWLVERGLAKPGRGKFSKPAHAALRGAMGGGYKFDDYPKAPEPVKAPTKKPTKKTVTKKSDQKSEPAKSATGNLNPQDSQYLFEDDYRYPEGQYRATANGKTVSLRECCNTCRVSLVNHACDSPTIHGNVAVTIVRG